MGPRPAARLESVTADSDADEHDRTTQLLSSGHGRVRLRRGRASPDEPDRHGWLHEDGLQGREGRDNILLCIIILLLLLLYYYLFMY